MERRSRSRSRGRRSHRNDVEVTRHRSRQQGWEPQRLEPVRQPAASSSAFGDVDRRREPTRRGESSSTFPGSLSVLSEAIEKGMGKVAERLLAVSSDAREVSVSPSVLGTIISEFDPLNQNVDDWISSIDEYATLYKWGDATTCHLALSKLRGPAETWYRGLPTRMFTWGEWRQLLLTTFGAKRDLHSAMEKMIAYYKYQKHDSLYEYVFKKLSLIHNLKLLLTGEDQVNLIKGGKSDQQIKLTVETAGIKDPTVLASHFKLLHGQGRDHQGAIPTTATTVRHFTESSRSHFQGKVSHPHYYDERRHSKAGPGTKSDRNVGKKTEETLKCYECGQRGHFRRFCPNVKSKSNKQLAIEPKRVNFIGRTNDQNKKFFKTIVINNNETCTAFVDCGSECSIISEAAATKFHLLKDALKSPTVLSSLGDNVIVPKSSVSAYVTIDGINKQIGFYVVEKCVMDVEMLIGQNFTELPDICYSKIGNQLTFYVTDAHRVNVIAESEVNVGVKDQTIINDLLELLDEYSVCTSKNMTELGSATGIKMSIELTCKKPIAHRARQFPDNEREQVREIVAELLENGVIRESNSPYASAVLLVKKKDGSKRLCVDYRALNKIIIQDKYPLPLIEEQLRRLSGFRYFTSLDLFAGYYQVPMSEESIAYTAFVTQDGHYEFTRVAFGLTTAPAVFQRMLNMALGQLRFTKVTVYLDDILVPAHTPEESLSILREVFEALKNNGLTLKLSKCNFFQTEIEYLGYKISENLVNLVARKSRP